ncbi:MAG: hypothetical protein BWK80_37290 [Desulfobacteraceae bacterium IS3]|nr:MAG: hypothetical protein BWK80_37290 [Desulfobacteraceae bacterium IS3]
MGKRDKKEISFEKTMKNSELISYLEAIVKSLKEGKIVIEQGGQFVSLTPGEMITVEMETKQKKDKERLALEFSWKAGLVIEHDEESVKISSEAPMKQPYGDGGIGIR